MTPKIIVVTSAYGYDTVVQLGGQSALLEIIKASGADGVEIRQELLTSADELKNISNKIKGLGLNSVYSVPSTLFDDSGNIALKLVQNSLQEAASLGAHFLKLSLGHLPSQYDLTDLSLLLAHSPVQLVIENDQTPQGGHIAPLVNFFDEVKAKNAPIKMTFDMANWHWHGEDAVIAAQTFAPFVAYIHVKESQEKDHKRVAVALDDSDGDWRKVLCELPKGIPRGIEFPLVDHDLVTVTTHYVNLLKGF